jgi:RNA polymerase sigma-70 factor (ECF subfamily)
MLYDRYGQLLYTIALRITGDRAVAEEVIQDVFYAVWQTSGSFHLGYPVIPWLIGITRHRAIDATRTRYFRARARETALDTAYAPGPLATADAQIPGSILPETVQQALAALAPRERQVIDLAYYGGLTQREIAAQLGEPVGTVKSRMRTALSKLHAIVARDP